MMCASISGPSMHACLRIVLPSMVTGTMQAPHMPVASTMIEFRLATVCTPNRRVRSDTARIITGGPIATTSATSRPVPAAAASSIASSGVVTKPSVPNVPSFVV